MLYGLTVQQREIRRAEESQPVHGDTSPGDPAPGAIPGALLTAHIIGFLQMVELSRPGVRVGDSRRRAVVCP